MSSRLRTYIRVAGVGISNNAKVAFDAISCMADTGGGASAARVAEITAKVEQLSDELETISAIECKSEQANMYYDFLCDLVEEGETGNKGIVADFAKHLLDSDPDDEEAKAADELGQRFIKEVCAGLDCCMAAHDYFSSLATAVKPLRT